jgi:alginate O-acetyltransferase complex protein AlgI
VVWGLYHGFFLVVERTRFGVWLDKFPRPLRHGYAIFVVMMGWVLFRANSYAEAHHFFLALFGLGHAPAAQPLARYLTNESIWALAFGIPFCGPLWGWINHTCARLGQATPASFRTGVQVFGAVLELVLVIGLLLISAIWLAGGTYNPFIYYRF